MLEILVSTVIVATAMLVVVQAMSRVQNTYLYTSGKVREAQDARAALETLSRVVSRATLDPRWTVGPPDETDVEFLSRQSDLHFVSGPATDLFTSTSDKAGHAVFFQAPLGQGGASAQETTQSSFSGTGEIEYQTLPNVLNAWGYYVEFGDDPVKLPGFLSSERRNKGLAPRRHRFRLMEFRQPAHELQLFAMDDGDPPQPHLARVNTPDALYEWFNDPLQAEPGTDKHRSTIVADNVLALVIHPQSPFLDTNSASSAGQPVDIAPKYLYDSRRHQWERSSELAAVSAHRLPSAILISVIVLDELDWQKFTESEAVRAGQELRSRVNSLFRTASNFTEDMGSLVGELNRRKLKHRVISTVVHLPAGRWITDREAGS